MNQLVITTNNLPIDESTTQFAKKKFKKIIQLLPKTATVNLVFSQQNQHYIIDANITTPGQEYHAQSTDLSLYTCLKHLAEKFLRQITNKKK